MPSWLKPYSCQDDRVCPINNIENQPLSVHQEDELRDTLKKHIDAFSWSYKDMKGVHPLVCTHRIYIKEGFKLVHQPQRRMGLSLKYIVKEEL